MSDPTRTVTRESRPAGGGQDAVWCVCVVASADDAAQGRVIPVTRGLAFGRGDVKLSLADASLSRRHATVRPAPGGKGWAVVDHDSKNGTFADGERIAGRRAIGEGAVIRAGDTVLVLVREYPGVDSTEGAGDFVGASSAHRQVLARIRQVAPSGLSVLVCGETGTGKEVAAARIHALSGRSGRFVAVNCAAIPHSLAESTLFGHRKGAFTGASSDADGCFTAAGGGTLFLDEIGELPLDLQPKLLRVLETGRFHPVGATRPLTTDARIVAATNRDLRAAADTGSFRMDLYARLAGFVLPLPPLRDRRPDIPVLVQYFLRTLAPGWTPRLDVELLERLLLLPWPMNVRELRTWVQRLGLLNPKPPVLRQSHVADDPIFDTRSTPSVAETAPVEEMTRERLVSMLEAHHGNVGRVARASGKHRQQVYRWLERFELSAKDYR